MIWKEKGIQYSRSAIDSSARTKNIPPREFTCTCTPASILLGEPGAKAEVSDAQVCGSAVSGTMHQAGDLGPWFISNKFKFICVTYFAQYCKTVRHVGNFCRRLFTFDAPGRNPAPFPPLRIPNTSFLTQLSLHIRIFTTLPTLTLYPNCRYPIMLKSACNYRTISLIVYVF